MESTEDLPKLNLQPPPPPHPTYSPLSHPKQNQKPPAWLFLLERGDFKKERKKEGVKRGIWYKTEKGEGEGGERGRTKLLLRASLVQDQVDDYYYFCCSCSDWPATTSLMIVTEIHQTFFICCLLPKHLFFICDSSEIRSPPLKTSFCSSQRCFPLVFRPIPKPNAQINLKSKVYAPWMFLQQVSYLLGQNVTKRQGQWENRNPLNAPWTTVYAIITAANEAPNRALTTP